MVRNGSGTPDAVLANLGLTGIDKVDVQQRLVEGATVYRKQHRLDEAPFAGPCIAPSLHPDQQLRLAAQFFSAENRDSNKEEMHGGQERLKRRDLADCHAFGLRPVIDRNVSPNERMVPSLVSLQEYRQETPGPNVCHNFPGLALSICRFWEQPVRNHQAANSSRKNAATKTRPGWNTCSNAMLFSIG